MLAGGDVLEDINRLSGNYEGTSFSSLFFLKFCAQCGARSQDPKIKSHVLPSQPGAPSFSYLSCTASRY